MHSALEVTGVNQKSARRVTSTLLRSAWCSAESSRLWCYGLSLVDSCCRLFAEPRQTFEPSHLRLH